ncbi:MAG TPA: hypothetical protein VHR15_12815 [Ktedonobacterales bacterium]|nr:hypothetical protein [Ktedonobacterales bacterium]
MDRTTRLAALAVMLAVSVIVAGCGALTGKAGTYSGAPESVTIIASLILPPTPATIEVKDAATAQRLYDAAIKLPVAPQQRACLAIAGPHYEMTFHQSGKLDVTFAADRGGCQDVTLAQNDVRQSDEAFWTTLERIVFDFAPPFKASRLDILRFAPGANPTFAAIPNAQAAQAVYDAARALPAQAKDPICDAMIGPRSELLFFAGDQRVQVTADQSGCGSVTFPQTSDKRQPDTAFWDLLAKTADGVKVAEARPDHLAVKTEPINGNPSGVAGVTDVRDAALIAKLYDVTLALPPLSGKPSCATPSQTLYGLSFEIDGLSLLTAVTDQSGCAAVTLNDNDQRATTPEFWALARQAAG